MGMLVREGEVVWRSEEMWWDFNTPLQLGPSTHPSHMESSQLKAGQKLRGITPVTIGHTITLPVLKGDIVILGSDGVGDNLWDEDVREEVRRFLADPSVNSGAARPVDSPTSPLEGKTLAAMLSEALCSRARRVSERRGEEDGEVPFGRRAKEAGRKFRGGKVDDISVVVAVISPMEPAELEAKKGRSRSPSVNAEK